VVAIGVFDGVHLGHQELIAAVATQARYGFMRAVVVTFDPDPAEVTVPQHQPCRLLALDERIDLIGRSGAGTVLVLPFSAEIAQQTPEGFLTDVLGSCMDVCAMHVGSDFRFGAQAAGDTAALQAWCDAHGADLVTHGLVDAGGQPITSSRIRGLVAAGDVIGAACLLGRPHQVCGRVGRGRGQGRQLGFPTANVRPEPGQAIPADGVYAGSVRLGDGSRYLAAVSVGAPPTFPEATASLEAHLIGFKGDLYGETVSLCFFEHIREHQAFGSAEELAQAIKADVEIAGETSGETFELNPALAVGRRVAHALGMDVTPDPEYMEDGQLVVEDPDALRAAEEQAARRSYAQLPAEQESSEEWVEVVEPRRLSGLMANAGATASIVTAPLTIAHIPFLWHPYPPEKMPSFRPAYGVLDRPFSLMVPLGRLEEAKAVLGVSGRAYKPSMSAPAAATVDCHVTADRRARSADDTSRSRVIRILVWVALLVAFLFYMRSYLPFDLRLLDIIGNR